MDDRNVILANFQACTAIDDYSVCLAILEQHNWDLQNAVNAALTQVKIWYISASFDVIKIQSSSSPSPPPTAQVQRNKTLKFEIKSGASIKTITFDEDGTVGTLLQVIASEMDLPMTSGRKSDILHLCQYCELSFENIIISLQLHGWPGGSQPDDAIPLNLLDLPQTTKLLHDSPAASRWDDSPPSVTSSNNPFQALSSRTSSSQDSTRKFAHFTLKIHDIDNDDRHELKVS